MLPLEKLCKEIGFATEQISRLIVGQPIQFSGSLYSQEHKRKFDTENSTAKVVQEPQTRKLHLNIDGSPIAKWFAEKYTQHKEQKQAAQSQTPPKRGIRM